MASDEQYSIPNPQIQQVEQPIKSDELYATLIQEERAKNLVAQISPDNQLLELQWRIKGYVKDPLTRQWEKVDKDAPEPSPLLVSRFISYLSSLLNQNTTMSNLSTNEINMLMKQTIEWVTDDLDANAEEYCLGEDKKVGETTVKEEVFEIKLFVRNYSEMTRVGHILLNNTFMVLKRAQNGMESSRVFKMLNVTETLSQNQGKPNILKEALQVWK